MVSNGEETAMGPRTSHHKVTGNSCAEGPQVAPSVMSHKLCGSANSVVEVDHVCAMVVSKSKEIDDGGDFKKVHKKYQKDNNQTIMKTITKMAWKQKYLKTRIAVIMTKHNMRNTGVD